MEVEYIKSLKQAKNLKVKDLAEMTGIPESTINNFLSRKTESPSFSMMSKLCIAVGGSLDEMYTGKSKDKIKEFSIESIKEMYEFQLAEYKATEEAHIANIRLHYEQHRDDVTTNYEKRLEDKREIIKEKDKQINFFKIIAAIGYAVLIGLLIAEVMNPSLGWIKF